MDVALDQQEHACRPTLLRVGRSSLFHSKLLSSNSTHHVSFELARSEVTPSHERGNLLEDMMMCANTLDHLRSYLSFKCAKRRWRRRRRGLQCCQRRPWCAPFPALSSCVIALATGPSLCPRTLSAFSAEFADLDGARSRTS
jgi:hypothetical protein